MYFLIILFLSYIGYLYYAFSKSIYYSISGNNFIKTFIDKGNYGEYLTVRMLEKIKLRLEGESRILTNIYVEKNDENELTEIDIVFLTTKGIFVIESKNYSGWIFGRESDRNWTQSLKEKNGKSTKFKFFNPIWQNRLHIDALEKLLMTGKSEAYLNYIIFSERCVLKKIEHSDDVKVINRGMVKKYIGNDLKVREDIFNNKQIFDFYIELKKNIKVDETIKSNHINQIEMKKTRIKR